MDALDQFCRAIPKVELHVHLLGATLPATFAEWAARAGMPPAEAEALYSRDAKPKGVLHILRALEGRLLKRPTDLHRIAYEHLQAAAAENVRHSEIFWNPTGTAHLFPYAAGADAILAGFADAATDLGVSALLIPAIDREDTPEAAAQLVEWMAAHRRDAIVGLGIDYRETDRPPELFWRAWRAARAAGFRLTCHAGEFGCHPRNISTALDLVGVDRLDHAYTAVEDPALLEQLRDSGIVVTVVPTNSYYLRTLPPDRWALDHPIRAMAAAGLAIHPNTDDPPMHRITPGGCWALLARELGFGRDALRGFTLNGIRGAFLEDAAKRHLATAFAAEFDALEFPAA